MNKEVQNRDERQVQEERQNAAAARRPRIFPAYEVWEEKGTIQLRLEMPGLERDDIGITVENNKLVIQGSRPDWSVEGAILIRERRVGDYYREFTLDKTVDTEKIDATMSNGVLTVTLGIAKEAQPRRIEIKTT